MKNLLRVIQLHTTEAKLIRRACAHDREAQQEIYRRFAPKMLSVCRYYIRDLQFAEDAMISGFLKVLTRLDSYKNEGSLEGWIRRIMVRECLSYLRSKKQMLYVEDASVGSEEGTFEEITHLEVEDIQQEIDRLPEGYRVVFLMYAIEGYSHKEIADLTGISEGTSKSQLFKARKMLQQRISERKTRENGTTSV